MMKLIEFLEGILNDKKKCILKRNIVLLLYQKINQKNFWNKSIISDYKILIKIF